MTLPQSARLAALALEADGLEHLLKGSLLPLGKLPVRRHEHHVEQTLGPRYGHEQVLFHSAIRRIPQESGPQAATARDPHTEHTVVDSQASIHCLKLSNELATFAAL